jgi:hypothetical protein
MLNSARLILLAIATAIGIGLPGAAIAAEPSSTHHAAQVPGGPGEEFASAVAAAMHKMHEEMSAARLAGDPDRDFLALMIPHHAGAIEMARLLLLHGRDPLVRQLAEDIIAAQRAEIAAMQARLAILARGQDADPDGFPAISGTRGQAPQ